LTLDISTEVTEQFQFSATLIYIAMPTLLNTINFSHHSKSNFRVILVQ